MNYKRILTIQDISCVGQCSLTVALPILSAMGYETAILPTGILSNHTAKEFNGFTFQDTTNFFTPIFEMWKKNDLTFDCIYTGYLGNKLQIQAILENLSCNKGKFIVDPAMADNGKLYTGFNDAFVSEMKKLCAKADLLLPNVTEACLLSNTPYHEEWTEEEIEVLCKRLCKDIVLTGIPFGDELGIAVMKDGKFELYRHERLKRNLHGTGDIFSSVFVGEYLKTQDELLSAKKAARFVIQSMQNTTEEHFYGAMFEPFLKNL